MKSVDTVVKSVFVSFVHCMLLLLKIYLKLKVDMNKYGFEMYKSYTSVYCGSKLSFIASTFEIKMVKHSC